jgi:hypothetical protein
MNKADETSELYRVRNEEIKRILDQIDIKNLDITKDDLFDPYCNPEQPVEIKFNDISGADYQIRKGIEHTPCTVI